MAETTPAPVPLTPESHLRSRRPRWALRLATIAIVTGAALTLVVVSGSGNAPTTNTTTTAPTQSSYPVGTPDPAEPSGLGPTAAAALAGFTQTYVTDFAGTSLPPEWDRFSGVPGGVPDGQFGAAHVVVSGGLLHLDAWRDPDYEGRWVTGGTCLCTLSQTYGAYFVRSRLTGPGPNEVQLLWPAANTWPPEVDFYESGSGTTGVAATVHYGAANNVEQYKTTVDLTKWHTFGVIWQQSSVVFTVDGRVWGDITLPWQIPNQAMTLHLQQQASCVAGLTYWCPQRPVSMEVDWVTEYAVQSSRASAGRRG
jgi:Glycosyl hydrolases family 16